MEQDSKKTKATQDLIDRAFSGVLAPSLVDGLRKNPALMGLEGRKLYFTTMVTNIRGFESIRRSLDVGVFSFINDYFDVMSKIVLDNLGMILFIEGDALIVTFGAPVPFTDHAFRACKAACEMQQQLPAVSERWKSKGVPPLEFGVGINTGEAFAGNGGWSDCVFYTVMGQEVNVAARLERLTKKYGVSICITENTLRDAGDNVTVNRLGSVPIPLSPEPVTIYELAAIG